MAVVKNRVYLAGDIMSYGSQMEMKRIEDICQVMGLPFYSARLNKEINDKKNQTKHSNANLAEKIVLQDTTEIANANVFIINYKPHALGTTVEIGQILARFEEDPTIKVVALYDDIRRTDIEEVGDRRSYGVNQYVYGAILKLTNGRGFTEIDDLMKVLVELLQEDKKQQVADPVQAPVPELIKRDDVIEYVQKSNEIINRLLEMTKDAVDRNDCFVNALEKLGAKVVKVDENTKYADYRGRVLLPEGVTLEDLQYLVSNYGIKLELSGIGVG